MRTNLINKILLIVFFTLINFSFQYNSVDPVFYIKNLFFTTFLFTIILFNPRLVYLKNNYLFILLGVIVVIVFNIINAYNISHTLNDLSIVFLFMISLIVFINVLKNNIVTSSFLIYVLLLIAISHSIIGLFQIFNLGFRDIPPYELFPYGILVNKNLFTSYLVLNLPLVLYLKNSFLRILILGILIIPIYLSGSLAGFITLIFMFVLFLKKREYLFISSLVLMLAFFIYYRINIFSVNSIGELYDTFLNNYYNNLPSSINERLVLWKSTFRMIKDNLILGVGAGNWEFLIWKYKPENLISNVQNIALLRPHNQVLKLLAEYGLIVFILAIVFFTNVLIKAFKKNKLLFLILFLLAFFLIVDFPLESIAHLIYIYICYY